MYKAAIFDLDGTLVDSMPDIGGAANCALQYLGLPTFTIGEIKTIAGGGHYRLMTRAITLAQDGIPPTEDQLMRSVAVKKRVENGPNGHDRTKPFPGIHTLLRQLQEEGLQLAILSNTNEQTVRKLVAQLFPDIKFKHVAGARDGTPLKPDPTAALRIIKGSFDDVLPTEIIYIGDTDLDMKTALRAGVTPIAVPWGCRRPDELYANGASVVVRKPEDILKIAMHPGMNRKAKLMY